MTPESNYWSGRQIIYKIIACGAALISGIEIKGIHWIPDFLVESYITLKYDCESRFYFIVYLTNKAREITLFFGGIPGKICSFQSLDHMIFPLC